MFDRNNRLLQFNIPESEQKAFHAITIHQLLSRTLTRWLGSNSSDCLYKVLEPVVEVRRTCVKPACGDFIPLAIVHADDFEFDPRLQSLTNLAAAQIDTQQKSKPIVSRF